MTVKDEDTRKKLLDALVKSVSEHEGTAGDGSFKPRHGIRVVHDGKTYDIVIGFDSQEGHFFINGKRDGGFLVSKSPQAVFDKVLTDAKVSARW